MLIENDPLINVRAREIEKMVERRAGKKKIVEKKRNAESQGRRRGRGYIQRKEKVREQERKGTIKQREKKHRKKVK